MGEHSAIPDQSLSTETTTADKLPPPRDEAYPLRWTSFRKRYFIVRLADTGNVLGVCRELDMSRQSAYALRARDPIFARAWQGAMLRHRDALVDLCMERAMVGVTEEIVADGQLVERTRPDGAMLRHMLNRADRLCADDSLAAAPALESERQLEALLDCMEQAPDEEAEAVWEDAAGDEADGAPVDPEALLAAIEQAGAILPRESALEAAGRQAREEVQASAMMGFASETDALAAIRAHPEIMAMDPEDIDISDLDGAESENWSDAQILRANRSGQFVWPGEMPDDWDDGEMDGVEWDGAELVPLRPDP